MSEWCWVLHDADGKDLRTTDGFPTKEAAEAWMGDHWSELLDEGAETVSLKNGDAHEYRMGLKAE